MNSYNTSYMTMLNVNKLISIFFTVQVSLILVSLKLQKDIIETLGGLEVINVPGHTQGSIALYQSKNEIMFFGDVIRNKRSKGLVIGVPDKFNYDTIHTIKDAQHLMNYPIKYALFGHGVPITENVERLLITARTPEEVKASRKIEKLNAIHKNLFQCQSSNTFFVVCMYTTY